MHFSQKIDWNATGRETIKKRESSIRSESFYEIWQFSMCLFVAVARCVLKIIRRRIATSINFVKRTASLLMLSEATPCPNHI